MSERTLKETLTETLKLDNAIANELYVEHNARKGYSTSLELGDRMLRLRCSLRLVLLLVLLLLLV